MSKKKIYDISLPLSADLPVWPGDPAPVIERFSKMEDGEDANVSRMEMGVHFGTHIDAPFHFVQDGSKVEDVPLDCADRPGAGVAKSRRTVMRSRRMSCGMRR